MFFRCGCHVFLMCFFAIRYNPTIKKYYQRKLAKTNKIVAIKAVAHKLARACYHVLNVGYAQCLSHKGLAMWKHKPQICYRAVFNTAKNWTDIGTKRWLKRKLRALIKHQWCLIKLPKFIWVTGAYSHQQSDF